MSVPPLFLINTVLAESSIKWAITDKKPRAFNGELALYRCDVPLAGKSGRLFLVLVDEENKHPRKFFFVPKMNMLVAEQMRWELYSFCLPGDGMHGSPTLVVTYPREVWKDSVIEALEELEDTIKDEPAYTDEIEVKAAVDSGTEELQETIEASAEIIEIG